MEARPPARLDSRLSLRTWDGKSTGKDRYFEISYITSASQGSRDCHSFTWRRC